MTGSGPGRSRTMINDAAQVAGIIDQTLLKPDAGHIACEDFIQRNANVGFHTLFVPPTYLSLMVRLLSKSKTLAGAAVGFPFGWETRREKLYQLNQALSEGADEVDFVINISKLKSSDYVYIKDELKALREEALKSKNKFGGKVILKCIIECCLLSDDEKRKAASMLADERIDFVKTSTGISRWGAKVEDIKLLNEAGRGLIKVKAAGGIRTLADLEAMVEAGASRIGTSTGLEILAEMK
jgi:deoxyribose-phosphate aldolase